MSEPTANRVGYATTSEGQGLAWASTGHEARLQRFVAELRSNNISLDNLRSLAHSGIPDKKGLRALTWKVANNADSACTAYASVQVPLSICKSVLQLLLGYLPVNATQWDKVLKQRRATYREFCQVSNVSSVLVVASICLARVYIYWMAQDLIIKPGTGQAAFGTDADHPLSQHSNSRWNAFFQVDTACTVTARRAQLHNRQSQCLCAAMAVQ